MSVVRVGASAVVAVYIRSGILASVQFDTMSYSFAKCTCGKFLKYTTENSRKAQLSRCKAKHIEPESLSLVDGTASNRSVLWVILSHRGAEFLQRAVKKDLNRKYRHIL